MFHGYLMVLERFASGREAQTLVDLVAEWRLGSRVGEACALQVPIERPVLIFF